MTAVRLFAGPPLVYSLATITNRMLDAATNLPAGAFAHDVDQPPPDVARTMAAAAALTVPVIDWDSRKVSAIEKPVTVMEWDSKRGSNITSLVPGVEVVTSFPFVGSRLLLTATPSEHFIGGFDTAVRVRPLAPGGGLVQVTVTGRRVDVDTLTAYLANVAANVERYLRFVRADLAKWERELSDRLIHEVGERAAFLAALANLDSHLHQSLPPAAPVEPLEPVEPPRP